MCVSCVFSGALKNGFVNWDDDVFIHKNAMIHSLHLENFLQMAVSGHTGNWHPLTWLTHALDYHFFGLDSRGHHITNILLHAANTVLAYLLFQGFLIYLVPSACNRKRCAVAAFSALLFAVHPLKVESVAWISERKDLLCGFFVLATYLVYMKYALAVSPGKGGYLFVLIMFLQNTSSNGNPPTRIFGFQKPWPALPG